MSEGSYVALPSPKAVARFCNCGDDGCWHQAYLRHYAHMFGDFPPPRLGCATRGDDGIQPIRQQGDCLCLIGGPGRGCAPGPKPDEDAGGGWGQVVRQWEDREDARD